MMKVEIWSDVMCPFCYIGKRKFEAALEDFAHKDEIEIEWKSFFLDPTIETNPDKNVYQHLAERKGWTLEHSKQMHEHVIGMAKEVGLTYNFDKAVVANSLRAHLVLQLAKTKGLGNAMEEQLFKAYFTDGKNTDDPEILVELGKATGLTEEEVRDAIEANTFHDSLNKDLYEAQQIGVSGVPFFVLNRKFGVSGAQPVDTFKQALEKSFADFKEKNANMITQLNENEGASCNTEGECD